MVLEFSQAMCFAANAFAKKNTALISDSTMISYTTIVRVSDNHIDAAVNATKFTKNPVKKPIK